MPAKKHHIRLSDEERQQLETILNRGKSSAHRQRHARILLLADLNGEHGAKMDAEIADAVQVSVACVERVRRICVEHGLDHALTPRKAARTYTRKLDGKAEAILVAQCCAEPPKGYARWTLRLLADRLVELEVVDSICRETVRATLERNELKPWQKWQWVIPPEASCEFVAAMEDVLDVYAQPPDPKRPLVCIDETTKQLTIETRTPIPMAPGQVAREDYEYERNGVSAIFCAVAPHLGLRFIEPSLFRVGNAFQSITGARRGLGWRKVRSIGEVSAFWSYGRHSDRHVPATDLPIGKHSVKPTPVVPQHPLLQRFRLVRNRPGLLTCENARHGSVTSQQVSSPDEAVVGKSRFATNLNQRKKTPDCTHLVRPNTALPTRNSEEPLLAYGRI